MTNKEIEQKIRRICTYSSGDAYGSTCGYNLSEEQFEELFKLFETIKREAVEGFINYIEEYFAEDFNYIRDEIEGYLVKDKP